MGCTLPGGREVPSRRTCEPARRLEPKISTPHMSLVEVSVAWGTKALGTPLTDPAGQVSGEGGALLTRRSLICVFFMAFAVVGPRLMTRMEPLPVSPTNPCWGGGHARRALTG